jgi:predicted metal-dependent phosphoesterase TrpH
VRAAGGVTSVAHAVWYKDAEGLIRALAAEGLGAIEVFHPDHGPDEERRFLSLAGELDLATTAGSDFHGTVEGRKKPGAVVGDQRMLDALRARRPR